jgi:hypothetical protein
VGESLPARWQRFLDGLDAAIARRAPAGPSSAEPGPPEPEAHDVFKLERSRRAVAQAWTGAPELFVQLDTALAALASGVDLSPFEIDLIAVLLGADVDPSFAGALTLLNPDAVPGERPTIGAVLELLGVANVIPGVRAALRSGGVLHRTGLVRARGGGPFLTRALVLPDRVGAQLLGDLEPDADLASCLLSPCPLELPGGAEVAQLWRDGTPLVWVQGAQGSAGLAMVAGAVRELPVVAIDLSRIEPSDQGERVDAAVLEAVLAGGALIVVGLPGLPASEVTLIHRLSEAPIPVAVISDSAWNPNWASWLPPTVPAPRLPVEQRHELWTAELDQTLTSDPSRDGWPDLLALQVTPEEIQAVSSLARRAGTPTTQDLLSSARRLSDQSGAVRRGDVALDDLILPAPTRAGLEELISWARHRDAVLTQGPLTGKGKGRGIAALFAGGSGTGKTLAAQAVAGSLGLDLYQVDLTSVVDKYIGEAEKRLARIFATAERLNCLLFFDEADSLFGTRTAVTDARDRYANLEVSYLLQRLEQFDGLVVLATNLRGNLDAAFTRRLHFVLHFPEPDEAARAALWQLHLGHVGALDPEDRISTEALAGVEGITGGAIRNAVLSAAFAAQADNEGRVGHRHLVTALDRELRKMGRRVAPVRISPENVPVQAVSTLQLG